MYIKNIFNVRNYKGLDDGFNINFSDITYIIGDNAKNNPPPSFPTGAVPYKRPVFSLESSVPFYSFFLTISFPPSPSILM